MKRKFETLGVFAPSRCNGSLLEAENQSRIARALKDLGFRETRWQYIFEGQLYGLVLPYRDGRNEVHVRFYHDRIFAEYEIGRSTFAHFLGPFRNANNFIKSQLRDSLRPLDYLYLSEMTRTERLCEQEVQLPVWDFQNGDSLEDNEDSKSLFGFEGADLLRKILSWRVVFGLPIAGASIFFANASTWLAVAIALVGAGILTQLAPQAGRP